MGEKTNKLKEKKKIVLKNVTMVGCNCNCIYMYVKCDRANKPKNKIKIPKDI